MLSHQNPSDTIRRSFEQRLHPPCPMHDPQLVLCRNGDICLHTCGFHSISGIQGDVSRSNVCHTKNWPAWAHLWSSHQAQGTHIESFVFLVGPPNFPPGKERTSSLGDLTRSMLLLPKRCFRSPATLRSLFGHQRHSVVRPEGIGP